MQTGATVDFIVKRIKEYNDACFVFNLNIQCCGIILYGSQETLTYYTPKEHEGIKVYSRKHNK
jgi:hypothetical protein